LPGSGAARDFQWGSAPEASLKGKERCQ
jgi:hypothetical protein